MRRWVRSCADTGAKKLRGYGLTATYDAGNFKLTGNYAQGLQDTAANNKKSAFGLVSSRYLLQSWTTRFEVTMIGRHRL